MQYKVIPAPMAVRAKGQEMLKTAADSYANLINNESAKGWEFVCFDSTTVTEITCGCCDGQKTIIKMLVFKRPSA